MAEILIEPVVGGCGHIGAMLFPMYAQLCKPKQVTAAAALYCHLDARCISSLNTCLTCQAEEACIVIPNVSVIGCIF